MEHTMEQKEEMNFPEFNAKKMERFIKKDLYAAKLFEGLKSGNKEQRLEVVFNSCVLDDAVMSQSYENA